MSHAAARHPLATVLQCRRGPLRGAVNSSRLCCAVSRWRAASRPAAAIFRFEPRCVQLAASSQLQIGCSKLS